MPSLFHNLGAFVGHITKAIKAPASDRQEVSRTTETEQRTTPDGHKVTLRRTTIEEIDLPPNPDKNPR